MTRLSIEHITRGGIIKTLIVLGVFGAVVHGSAFLMFRFFKESNVATPIEQETQRKPAPPYLESRTGETLHQLRMKEDLILDSYAWVDRPHGIIRIPIERAMDLESQHSEDFK